MEISDDVDLEIEEIRAKKEKKFTSTGPKWHVSLVLKSTWSKCKSCKQGTVLYMKFQFGGMLIYRNM